MNTVNELFAVFVSVPVNVAEPVMEYELAGAAADGVALIVTVALPPPAMLPRLQLTWLAVMVHVPWLGLAELIVKTSPVGALVVAVNVEQLAATVPRLSLICQV